MFRSNPHYDRMPPEVKVPRASAAVIGSATNRTAPSTGPYRYLGSWDSDAKMVRARRRAST